MAAQAPSILIYHPTPKAKKGDPKVEMGELLPDGNIKRPPYFTIRGGNQNIAINKADALVCRRFLPDTQVLKPEEAAQKLAEAEKKIADALLRPVSGGWIGDEATACGHTLVDIIKAVVSYKKEVARTLTPVKVTDYERLTSLMVTLANNETGAEVFARLKKWIADSGDKAIDHFDKCAAGVKGGGRDEQGWVYVRKQDPAKKAKRDAEKASLVQVVAETPAIEEVIDVEDQHTTGEEITAETEITGEEQSTTADQHTAEGQDDLKLDGVA